MHQAGARHEPQNAGARSSLTKSCTPTLPCLLCPCNTQNHARIHSSRPRLQSPCPPHACMVRVHDNFCGSPASVSCYDHQYASHSSTYHTPCSALGSSTVEAPCYGTAVVVCSPRPRAGRPGAFRAAPHPSPPANLWRVPGLSWAASRRTRRASTSVTISGVGEIVRAD